MTNLLEDQASKVVFISLDDYKHDRRLEVPFIPSVGSPALILPRTAIDAESCVGEQLKRIQWPCGPAADLYFDPARLGWWLVEHKLRFVATLGIKPRQKRKAYGLDSGQGNCQAALRAAKAANEANRGERSVDIGIYSSDNAWSISGNECPETWCVLDLWDLRLRPKGVKDPRFDCSHDHEWVEHKLQDRIDIFTCSCGAFVTGYHIDTTDNEDNFGLIEACWQQWCVFSGITEDSRRYPGMPVVPVRERTCEVRPIVCFENTNTGPVAKTILSTESALNMTIVGGCCSAGPALTSDEGNLESRQEKFRKAQQEQYLERIASLEAKLKDLETQLEVNQPMVAVGSANTAIGYNALSDKPSQHTEPAKHHGPDLQPPKPVEPTKPPFPTIKEILDAYACAQNRDPREEFSIGHPGTLGYNGSGEWVLFLRDNFEVPFLEVRQLWTDHVSSRVKATEKKSEIRVYCQGDHPLDDEL